MNISENLEVRLAIEAEIDLLGQEYTSHKALILTERDLQCQLHSRLSKLPSLTGNHPTADAEVTGPRVHADLSWFDERGKLSILPDLSILEVDKLSIFRPVVRCGLFPSKQYSFSEPAIILEVKFCRWKDGITDAVFRKVKKDIDKIDGLLAKLAKEGFPNNLFCYFVVFSKSEGRCAMFQELQKGATSPHCKLIYKTAEMNYYRDPNEFDLRRSGQNQA